MKSIDDAIRSHVFERLKGEVLDELKSRLIGMNELCDVKSF